MSLARSLSRLLSSSKPQRWPPVRSSSCSLCTRTRTHTLTRTPSPSTLGSNPKSPEPSDSPKPSVIPFQAKVVNYVQLVGSVGVPVKLHALPDGTYAVAILVQESKKKGSPHLCIPVIFQGDLAEIAAFHLKERDLVYVTGELSGDSLSQAVGKAQMAAHSNIQVLANSLSFVQKTGSGNESKMIHNKDTSPERSAEMEENESDMENVSVMRLWSDLFANPDNWWDNRSYKGNAACTAFKHKKSGERLWINDSTPNWVLSKLDSLSPGQTLSGVANKPNNNVESLWHDLVKNPQNWSDRRGCKLNGLVHPKYPDFKHNSTREGLWLDTAPRWVIQKLESLLFSDSKSAKVNEKEDLWRNLVENPDKWLDNRSCKLKPNHPDFKHKESGEALWLGSSTPAWVLPKLPPAPPKQAASSKKPTEKSDTLTAWTSEQ